MTPSRWQLEVVRRDAEFVLYRVREPNAAEPKLAKAPTAANPAAACLERLEHECALRGELDAQWALLPLELVRRDGRAMLLLADPGGVPLDGLLGQPMAISLFLQVASALAAALGRLHQRGIVHKDIKPGNVWFDQHSGAVHLTGFGIATRLPRERQAPASPEDIAGTLAYMAPEQTGRMNRSIDSRSDLYALGVSFYEMLTGVLPFNASDPMEWVHCHIARQALPPDERRAGVPEQLSAIVMKLLAKTAEERYQTAQGLEADLRQCRAQWETHARIELFPLGAHDAPDRLLSPEKLYGREAEIATLIAAFERVAADGAPALVLVSGYAGIGKSSVVNELHKVLVPRHALFAGGKFDQYKRNIPYATLVQALQTLVHQVLGKSEAELGYWRNALQQALGPTGQLIVNLIPEIELIIGPQAAVPELPPREAQNRFQRALQSLLGVFARPAHPLVLFLDDLQWLDTATLELLDHLVSEKEVRDLLLIGAYRTNEVNPAHPLVRTLEAIRQAGAAVQEIVLAPLVQDDVGRLVADSLHCERERAAPLAQLVLEKSGGNPFFAIQFFTSLAEEGLLAFVPSEGRWNWDLKRIHAKGYTDNVVELMVGKLSRLPQETRDALKQFACMGNAVESATLGLVLDQPEEAIHALLWEAVRAGLVFRTDDGYAFRHDRVQEAAYSLIPESERAAEHLRIGRLFAARTLPQEVEEKIFEIASQFNRATSLITAPEEREQVAEFNLVAGRRAKAATAYSAALSYLAAGDALLASDSWEQRYALSFALAFHRAECEYLRGELVPAEQRLAILARRATNLVDLAAVTGVRVNLFTTLDQSDRSIEVSLQYLARLGVDWVPHPSREAVRQEFERIWQQLGNRPIDELVDLPEMEDPGWCATMDVLTMALNPALFTDQNLLCLVVGRMANLSLEHGNSDGSGIGYAFLGMLLGPHFDDYQAGASFARLAIDLVDKRGLDRFKARVYLHCGNVVNPWTQHFRSSTVLIRRAFETANRMGDITYAVYSCNHLITNLLATGAPLVEVQREAETGLDFARKARFGLIVDIITGQLRLIRALRGVGPAGDSSGAAGFDEGGFETHLAEDPRLAIAACWYWIRKLQERFFAGDYPGAVEAEAKAGQLLWTSPAHVELAEYHFYGALAHAALLESTESEESAAHREALGAHYRQIAEWTQNCPENFENRAALAAAEIARIEGRDLDAMRLYEKAIQSARKNGFVQNEALANERAAAFHRARGFDSFADTCLRQACDGYARWGADGKVRQLEVCHMQLRARSDGPLATQLSQLDLLSVAKASQAISGRIVLDELADTLMRIVLENAGAQTGYMLLVRDGQLMLVAETNVAQQDVRVQLHSEAGLPAAALPESMLNYVRRSGEAVLLADAAEAHAFSGDPYFSRHRPKSVLCLPILRQSALIGLLYLENNLATHAFTPGRVSVLELLASQAAISLENAQLYADLQQENAERRRAEAALREREARIQRFFESNIIGVFFWDLSGNVIEANEAFLQIIGYSQDDLNAGCIRWTDLTPPEWVAADVKAAGELLERGSCSTYEKEYVCKDGTRVPVLIGAALFEGSKENGVAFVLDLTARRQAEAEREARRAAETANRAKSAFLANMSHELRTPLNGILGYAQILQRDKTQDKTQDDRQSAGLKVIQQSGEHLLTLIDDILDFAKIEAGKLDLQLSDIQPARFLRAIAEMIGIKAAQKGLQFVCDLAPDLPKLIRADARRLRQVLLNLLSNAVKFTDSGQVSLRVHCRAPGRLHFEVQDSGIGIREDQLEAIFQPFEQVGDVQRQLGGTGLGLAIGRQFVRLMGGDLQVSSRVGQGSTFWFELEVQVVDGELAVAASERNVTGYLGPRRKILVVDDLTENRAVVIDMLGQLGFEMAEAVHGGEGLAQAQAQRPDLILMDIVMPGMDGLEATRRLREMDGLKDVPIIAISASTSDADRQSSLAAGVNVFLPKPIELGQLVAHIAVLLELSWTYGTPENSSTLEHEVDGPPLLVPPAEAMESLHHLARLGKMQDILQQANGLIALDERYRPFAGQLAALAAAYQSQAVLGWVERYLEK